MGEARKTLIFFTSSQHRTNPTVLDSIHNKCHIPMVGSSIEASETVLKRLLVYSLGCLLRRLVSGYVQNLLISRNFDPFLPPPNRGPSTSAI